MRNRVSRFGRVALLLTGLALLGGQQASAAWICLPPPACPLIWFFTLTTIAQEIPQSRFGMPPPSDSSEDAPPLCLTPPPSPSVFLQASKSDLMQNQAFSVKIYGDFEQPVVSFGFHLDYDSTRLTLREIDLAPRFRSLNTDAPSEVAAMAYPRSVAGNNVLLAVARFTASDLGTASIGVDIAAGDATEGFAYEECGVASPDTTPISVTIREPTPRRRPPVPEPTTAMGLMSALLLGRRRRHTD